MEKGLQDSKYTISPYVQYSEAGEMRWYAFIPDCKSKISLYLQMVNELDADLYLFSLNQETYELELMGGSAVTGNGITEKAICILDEGIYYLAVDGYSGSGAYDLTYYQSVENIQYEVIRIGTEKSLKMEMIKYENYKRNAFELS